ncbi:MAG: hypothetical protein ACI9K2_006271 [Myxococcota bacterium]|jgi:hypothetical protein
MAGAGVAAVSDGTAAYLNPAGLSDVRQPQVSLGLLGATASFEAPPPLWWDTNRDGVVDSADPPLEWDASMPPAMGLELAFARHLGSKFGLGAVVYVPTNTLIRFRTFEPGLPTYALWQNRLQRFVVTAGVGGEVAPGVQVGMALDLLARVIVDAQATLDASLAPPTTDGAGQDTLVVDVHSVDLDVKPALAPVIGIQLDLGAWTSALEGLRIGAGYHAPVGVPLVVRTDVQANLTVDDVGELDPYTTAIVATAELALFDHYVPPRLQLGAAWSWTDRLTLLVDTRFTDWRRFELSVAKATDAVVTSPLVQVDRWSDGNPYQVELRSVWSLRTGAELWSPRWEVGGGWRYLRLAARCGVGIEPTPLVSQGPASAILDASRTLITGGVGLETWDPLDLVDGALRFDAFFQAHLLATTALPRSSATPLAGYPVAADSLPVGGRVFAAGAQLGFDYR